MNDTDRFIVIGAYINSALYFMLVFVGAVVAHNQRAEYADISAIGVTYLSYLVQAFNPKAGTAIVGLSVVLGAAAGILLLF